MPAVIPIIVAGATYTGAAAAIGTAIAGAAISTAVATAIGAGVVATGANLISGKNIGDSLKAGVISGATAGIGSSIGAAMSGAGSATDAMFVAADASQLAAQGLSEAAITQNLVATGIGSATAQTAAQMAVSGATEAAISQTLGSGALFATPAPIETASSLPASDSGYPGVPVEQTYTPAPGSLQEALPGLGVETQASAAPFTAAPGSFAAATSPIATAAGYGVLGQIPSPSVSLQDAFRVARQANQLFGQQPQQQQLQQQQQQDQQQQQFTGVDLLQIPRIRAGAPNVAGLLSPAQASTMPVFGLYSGQPSQLPERLSLLG